MAQIERRMRKQLALAAGLVAVILAIVVPPLVAWSVRPYEPPLRVGMDQEEVHQLLGAPDDGSGGPIGSGF